MLVFHGPTVHRELQLWVEAGIPPAVALQAATLNAARLLRADARIGLVVKGHDANLLVVDGDPLATSRDRADLDGGAEGRAGQARSTFHGRTDRAVAEQVQIQSSK